MRIGRTLPPAATPISFKDLISGLRGAIHGLSEVKRFEHELKAYFGVKHCFLVSSGKAALTIILEALHAAHPDRTDVIIPAYTCYSVPSAVRRAGLNIKLCDIDGETLDFNYAQLQEILSGLDAERILALVPRHIFGIPADIERLRRLTSGLDIAVVEDAAQVMGGALAGKKLGTLGDAGVFSLGRGKAFSTVEGGIVLTNQDRLAERIKRLVDSLPEYGLIGKLFFLLNAIFLSIFMHPLLFWLPKSLPFLKVGATIYDTGFAIRRLSAFQAGLSRGWQSRLQALMRIRAESDRYWKSALKTIPTIGKLFSGFCAANGDAAPVRFVALMGSEIAAKRLLRQSDAAGLGIMMTYPNSVDGIPELRSQFNGRRFPVAGEYARNLLTFPTHGFISAVDKKRIIRLLIDSSTEKEGSGGF